MKCRSLPIKFADCLKCSKQNVLAYRLEGRAHTDIYRCLKCGALHSWNGIRVTALEEKPSVLTKGDEKATLSDMLKYVFSQVNFQKSFLDTTAAKSMKVLTEKLADQKEVYSLDVKI